MLFLKESKINISQEFSISQEELKLIDPLNSTFK